MTAYDSMLQRDKDVADALYQHYIAPHLRGRYDLETREDGSIYLMRFEPDGAWTQLKRIGTAAHYAHFVRSGDWGYINRETHLHELRIGETATLRE